MDQTTTPSTTTEQVVLPGEAQPKDSTLLFLMAYARLYTPVTDLYNESLLN